MQGILPFNPPQAQFAHLSSPQAPAVQPPDNPWARMVPNLIQSVVGNAIMAKIQDKLRERAESAQLAKEKALQEMRNENYIKGLQMQLAMTPEAQSALRFKSGLTMEEQAARDKAIADRQEKEQQYRQWSDYGEVGPLNQDLWGRGKTRQLNIYGKQQELGLPQHLIDQGYYYDTNGTMRNRHMEQNDTTRQTSLKDAYGIIKDMYPPDPIDNTPNPEYQSAIERFNDAMDHYGNVDSALRFAQRKNFKKVEPGPTSIKPQTSQTTQQAPSMTEYTGNSIPNALSDESLWKQTEPAQMVENTNIQLIRRPDGSLVPRLRTREVVSDESLLDRVLPSVGPVQRSESNQPSPVKMKALNKLFETNGIYPGRERNGKKIKGVSYNEDFGYTKITYDDDSVEWMTP